MLRKIGVIALLYFLNASTSGLVRLASANEAPPSIPIAQLDRYDSAIKFERVETIDIQRLHLVGAETIVMEVPQDYNINTKTKFASATFTHKYTSGYSYNLYSFPQKVFRHQLSDKTLNAYLENLGLMHKPEANYTILESAEPNDGRAKFRILGRKAWTIRYALDINEQRIIVAENWIQHEGSIYIVTIIGPERIFDTIYKQIRLDLNSMHLLE